MAQLAVYDRYPWEYTTFLVGGAVILIEDDRLAESGLSFSPSFQYHLQIKTEPRRSESHLERYGSCLVKNLPVTEAKLPGEGKTKKRCKPRKRLAAVLSGVPERI